MDTLDVLLAEPPEYPPYGVSDLFEELKREADAKKSTGSTPNPDAEGESSWIERQVLSRLPFLTVIVRSVCLAVRPKGGPTVTLRLRDFVLANTDSSWVSKVCLSSSPRRRELSFFCIMASHPGVKRQHYECILQAVNTGQRGGAPVFGRGRPPARRAPWHGRAVCEQSGARSARGRWRLPFSCLMARALRLPLQARRLRPRPYRWLCWALLTLPSTCPTSRSRPRCGAAPTLPPSEAA